MMQEPSVERIARKGVHMAEGAIKRLGKRVARSFVRWLVGFLVASAPTWLPVALVFLCGFLAYSYFYLIPKETMANEFASTEDKVSAFYGTSDPSFIKEKLKTFENYEQISLKWSEGLTPEQLAQASPYAMSWGVIAAVDRIIHDPANTGVNELKLNPEEVFQGLRSKFTWKQSTIDVTSQTCSERHETTETTNDDGTITETEKTVYEINTSTSSTPVTLLTDALTFEGDYRYSYTKQSTSTQTGSSCGTLTTTTTKEVIDSITPPTDRFKPFYDYLKQKGLTNENDQRMAFELAQVYDIHLQGDVTLKDGQEFADGTYSKQGLMFPVTVPFPLTTYFGQLDQWHQNPHKGIDIAAPPGTPFYAIDDGVVTYAGAAAGFGQVIYIRHKGGMYSVYGHIQYNAYGVKAGDQVQKGQYLCQIGFGRVGDSTGPHLHFEIHINGNETDTIGGKPIDPLSVVQPANGQMTLPDGKVWNNYNGD